MSLISELRRRNVLRMAVAYLAGSWLFLQVVETLQPVFGFDDTTLRYFVIALAIGFIPALAISWAFEWTPEGLRREQEPAPKTEAAKAQARTWDRIILVVMALALGLFAFDRFVLSPEREAALIEAATEAGAEMERAKVSAIAHESVAVLPFVNMSADPANEYFSDGLTETLLHMLAQLTDLKVAARTSSFAFKNKNVDIRSIAADLGVAHVLEGSVQKAANRVRITAQLIRADDGFHVWSQSYDRTLDDIFAIQDEIAADVARALGSTLLAGNDSAVVGLFTDDVDAYDIYLKALQQQAAGTFDALSKAEALFNEALLVDPSFIDAKLALMRNYILKLYSGVGEYDSILVASTRLISEVLAEDPDNLAARQYDLKLRSDAAAAAMDMLTRRALMDELVMSFREGYGDPFLRFFSVNYLVGQSRPDEALQLLQEALASDPLNVDLLKAQATLLWDTVGPDAAELPLKTALKVQPDNPDVLRRLGILEFSRKRVVKGLRYMRRVELVDPLDAAPTHEIALTLNEVGLYEHADRWLEEFRSRATARSQIIELEVHMAAERNDEAALSRIVPGAFAESLEGDPDDGIPNVLLNEYAVIMLADGNAQQGLDYIESFYPGISRIGGDAVTGWNELSIQSLAVLPLLRSLSDDATNRRNGEAFMALLQSRGVVIAEDNPGFVRIQYSRHGLDAAKAAFLATFTDDMYILSYNWHQFKRAPWAAALRADPDVIAVMAARELRIAELRDQVLEMMQEPEWQE